MNLNRLSLKISIFVGILITVAVLAIAGVIIVTQGKQIKEEVTDDALVFADYASGAIYQDYIQFYTHPSDSDFLTFKDLILKKLSNDSDIIQIKLVGVNGIVLFDSDEFDSVRYQGPERSISSDSELLELVKTPGISYREADNQLEVIRSIDELSGKHVLSAYYKVSYASVQEELLELYKKIALLLLPILIVSTFSAVLFSFSITKPLANLASAAKRIQKGETGVEVKTHSTDEVGQLTKAFNQMSSDLALQIRNVKQEHAKMNASINSLSVGFVMAGVKGEIIKMNPISKLILKSEKDLVNLEDINSSLAISFNLLEHFKECLERKTPIASREIQLGANYFDIYMTPIIEEDNSCIGVVILLNDTTEAKILDRSKDEFFSIASHELRTPLTAIMGNVDILRDYYKEKVKDEEINEIIADIDKSSERMVNIVNDFLDLSRLEVGNIEFKNEEIVLDKFIVDTIQEFQVMSSRKKLFLEYKKPESSVPSVFADKNKARQVLVNLIGNGFKFTKEGGVLIEAVDTNDGFMKISVKDTGMGIPTDNQKYLFRKFQQAGDSIYARDVTQGTGLGLYISKLIIEGMGGKIWLEESVPGKGSTFSFTLPIKQNA